MPLTPPEERRKAWYGSPEEKIGRRVLQLAQSGHTVVRIRDVFDSIPTLFPKEDPK